MKLLSHLDSPLTGLTTEKRRELQEVPARFGLAALERGEDIRP